jgi:hypothetical protein
MEITVICMGCGKQFEVVGEGGGVETSRPATCCYCQEVNDITWAVQGHYFVRGIPEHMEQRLDLKSIIEEQDRWYAAEAAKK